MNNKIYPVDIVETTVEYHLAKNSTKSQIIYIIVILAFVIAIVSLPFIYVNVTVQGSGIVRPVTEKTEVKALVSGRISSIYIKDGQNVQKDDTLIIIQSAKLTSQYSLLEKQKQEAGNYIEDLKKLVILKTSTFKTGKYQGEYYKFKEKIIQVKNKRKKAKRELNRNETLLEQEFISKKEYDDLKYQYTLVGNEYNIMVTNQLSIWKSDLSRNNSLLNELKSQIEQLQKEQEYYVIKAPVTGTIEQFNGIYEGTNIQAGQTISGISPETDLIAEVYVTSKDIGYLSKGSKLNIQVDAFNYNYWGMIKGEITEISDDYVLVENQPVFKIKCKMEKYYLSLRNGVAGDLKKGMTIHARFLLTERSLYQLMFDNVNDWLNPAVKSQ
ncbi:MAG: HlyD family efflux transporter periplasmic adaptor subunit [Bacteroidales bacterium]|nr:HlyD family efflux transporter periplasmic adaptor subunit [Bacteroidales bacterium]